MRFMLLMMAKGYETAAPGAMPDAKAVEAMMQYNDTLQRGGVLLSLEGLHPPSAGARISFGPAGATSPKVPSQKAKNPSAASGSSRPTPKSKPSTGPHAAPPPPTRSSKSASFRSSPNSPATSGKKSRSSPSCRTSSATSHPQP